MLSPQGVARHAKHNFIGSHLFNQPTSFHPLAGVDISQTGILICPEHAAGHLPESTTNQPMDIIRGVQHSRITGLHIISGRLTETLGNVYVVPVGQRGRLSPVRSVAMNLFGQFEQKSISRMTVKPVDADDVITSTTVLPIVFQKSVVGNRHLPFKVVCHQVYDTLVLRILVIRLQAPEHNHLCPKFAFSIAFVDRAEITVRLATGKYAFNPVFGFFYHLRIIQNICQTAIPFEPIGNFLPTMIPTGRKPGIVILFQPSADFP